MAKFKSYQQFNENIADLFRSAHAAIDPEELIPLEDLVGNPKFPSEEEFDQAIEHLEIDAQHLYYNPKDIISPFMYWDGVVYEPFHGQLDMEAFKMFRTKERLKHKLERAEKYLKSKNYEGLFSSMDKKVLIPSFIQMYNDIPDKGKYEIFKDLYVRSEYGFQSFPIDVIKDCFSKRKLSTEWKKRIEDFKKKAKLNPDSTITLYRGENVDSAKSDDAFSWTLNKKTAKFFADRFSKGSGRIVEKKVTPEEVIDYLDDRGESEVILFPKKFGKINEDRSEEWPSIIKLHTGIGDIQIQFTSQHFTVYQFHPNMGKIEWFTLDKDSNFSTQTTASEFFIFEKMIDMLSGLSMTTHRERKETIMSSPIFQKWIEKCKEKYKTRLISKKFGL